MGWKMGGRFKREGTYGGSDGKESACHAGDPGLILGSGRSPEEGHGYPLQYSCLENPMDRGTWEGTVHGITKGREEGKEREKKRTKKNKQGRKNYQENTGTKLITNTKKQKLKI